MERSCGTEGVAEADNACLSVSPKSRLSPPEAARKPSPTVVQVAPASESTCAAGAWPNHAPEPAAFVLINVEMPRWPRHIWREACREFDSVGLARQRRQALSLGSYSTSELIDDRARTLWSCLAIIIARPYPRHLIDIFCFG